MPARRSNQQPRRLKPRHKKLLADRAIIPEIAEARGYWTVEAPDELRHLGWAVRGPKSPPAWLRPPGLAIPLHSVLEMELGEQAATYSQFRPDRPARDKDGKVRKYVNPTGTQAVVDVNPGCHGSDLWLDRDTPLFIVEGVPKGDACWSHGLPAVSVQGVWNFTTQDEDNYRTLLPDLRYLPVAGREVVIAFDADAWTNSDVRAAARELGRVLSAGSGGASRVSALRLPDPEKKLGIDDFLARGGGSESVLELIVELDQLAEEKGARLRSLADVKAEPPNCLWEPYLLRNTLGFIDGQPGVGKTWIALMLCAAVTKGGKVPMGWRKDEELQLVEVPKGNVVYLTQENSPSTSLRPRFDQLGGDPKRFFIQEMEGGDDEEWFTLRDLGPLRRMIEEVDPVLVVLDPIMNYIGESTDAHRDNEVRPMLSRLMVLAEQTQTSIIGIRHLRKAATGSAVHAAGGSVAFSGAARSVVICAKYDKEGHGEATVMAHAKTNETPMGASMEYTIVDEGKNEEGFYLSYFEWKGKADVRADELVSERKGEVGAPKLDKMKNLLAQLLDANPDGVPVGTIHAAAESIDVSERTLATASKELGVVKERRKGHKGQDSPWIWKMGGPTKPGHRKRKEAPAGKKF